MEAQHEVSPVGSQFQIAERVMIAQAAMQFERIGTDQNVLRFITLNGRAYEFFIDDEGRQGIIRQLTGGIEVAATIPGAK